MRTRTKHFANCKEIPTPESSVVPCPEQVDQWRVRRHSEQISVCLCLQPATCRSFETVIYARQLILVAYKTISELYQSAYMILFLSNASQYWRSENECSYCRLSSSKYFIIYVLNSYVIFVFKKKSNKNNFFLIIFQNRYFLSFINNIIFCCDHNYLGAIKKKHVENLMDQFTCWYWNNTHSTMIKVY